MPATLYRLVRIQGQHIVLQAPSGGLRVIALAELTTHLSENNEHVVASEQVFYKISAEDYKRLRQLVAQRA